MWSPLHVSKSAYPADGYTATVEVAVEHAYTWSHGSFSRTTQLLLQEGEMTRLQHVHDPMHGVVDAHGRHVDIALRGQASTHGCPCTRPVPNPGPRGRPGAVVIGVVAVLTAGLVASVLLMVIRDIFTTVASTSATGLIIRALLTSSGGRER
ncbi:hypothetical protein [Streptomyces prunicolor]